MIHHALPAVRIAMGFAAGFGMGLAHFGTLGANLRLFIWRSAWRAVALQFVRIGMTALLFVVLARFGLLLLLAAGAGFLVARAAVLTRARRAS